MASAIWLVSICPFFHRAASAASCEGSPPQYPDRGLCDCHSSHLYLHRASVEHQDASPHASAVVSTVHTLLCSGRMTIVPPEGLWYTPVHIRFVAHVNVKISPSPSCSFFVLLVLTALSSHTAQPGLYVPSCTPCRSCLPPYRPPYTVQTGKLTESPPRPPSYGTTNTVCVANDIGHDADYRLSGVVVPRTRTSSSLARQSLIVQYIHVHICADVRLLSWIRPVALAVTRTSLCPSSLYVAPTRASEHQLPSRSAIKQ